MALWLVDENKINNVSAVQDNQYYKFDDNITGFFDIKLGMLVSNNKIRGKIYS